MALLKSAKGKVTFLRVGDTSNVWGSGQGVYNILYTEVIVKLEGFGGGGVEAVGFDLHVGDKDLPGRLGMLSVLRDAFIHQLPVGIAYWLEEGKEVHGYLIRVDLAQD